MIYTCITPLHTGFKAFSTDSKLREPFILIFGRAFDTDVDVLILMCVWIS